MKTRLRLLVFLAVLLGAALLVSSRAPRGDESPREIVLVAKGMAFALSADGGLRPAPDAPAGAAQGGAPQANPTLRLRAGERVRLVIHNLDRGMRHDLAVAGLGVRTRTLDFGESDAVVISAPRAPGAHEYVCSYHARLMRGRIEVE